MKNFNSNKSSNDATHFAIMTTLYNIVAVVLLYVFCSRVLLLTSFTPTLFMTLLLLYANQSFWLVGKKGNIVLDRKTLIFWSLFAMAYIALGLYLQAAPSMLGIAAGFCTIFVIQVMHNKIKQYRAS